MTEFTYARETQVGSVLSVAPVQVGFPVMIKATAGGGGRGMRLAMHEGEFMKLLQQAQQEADAAFGNPDMYLERYVQNPRHIEFQVGCLLSATRLASNFCLLLSTQLLSLCSCWFSAGQVAR